MADHGGRPGCANQASDGQQRTASAMASAAAIATACTRVTVRAAVRSAARRARSWMRHQAAPDPGTEASRTSALRSSRMASARATSSAQSGHDATCACNPASLVWRPASTSSSRSQRVSATFPTSLAQHFGELPARAMEERLHVVTLHARDAGNLPVRAALSVRQPEELALQRLETGQRAAQVRAVLAAVGGPEVGRRSILLVRERNIGMASQMAAVVAGEIGGDAEERVAAVRLALVGRTP